MEAFPVNTAVFFYVSLDFIWYIKQLTGCSYLVLESRSVFWGLTSFSNAALVFFGLNALHEMPTSFSGCSYLVLRTYHDVFGKPGYAPILLSI